MSFMRAACISVYSFFLFQLLTPTCLSQHNTTAKYGFGGRNAFSAGLSYAPTSKHVFAGQATDRRTSQAAIGYQHALKTWSAFQIAYEGTVVPLYLESDPTIMGASSPNNSGPPTIIYFPPYRITDPGEGFSFPIPITQPGTTPIAGPRQTTYAFAALPIGVRFTGIPHRRIQPTFAVNVGFLYAARNVPVDDGASFNILVYEGPGIEVFLTPKRSLRLEYLRELLSNRDISTSDPGLDSGTFRLTLTRYR